MNSKREPLPLTIEELKLVVDALQVYYDRHVVKAQPKELKEREIDSYKGKQVKVRQELAFIQQTLQFAMLCYNIRIGKLNPDVAESGGIPYADENANRSRE